VPGDTVSETSPEIAVRTADNGLGSPAFVELAEGAALTPDEVFVFIEGATEGEVLVSICISSQNCVITDIFQEGEDIYLAKVSGSASRLMSS
jgi:hypothetical protein